MMHASRREFLKTSGAVAALSCLGVSSVAAAPLSMPVGMQLYCVRDLLPKDFDGTLKQLHTAGYRVVEAAGYFNKTAPEWKRSMDQAGLKCVSSHHALAMLKPQVDQLIEYGHTIGLQYMVCSWAGMHRDPAAKGELTLDDWRWVADQFNEIGAKVKAAGMQFGYHNHTPEFGSENGVLFFDELLKRTDPGLVVFELDCGWVQASGHDAVAMLSKSPERFPLLHVKDMAKQPGGKFRSVVLGQGFIDYKPILKAATGLKQYFIEQEEFTGSPMQELREDVQFIQKLDV